MIRILAIGDINGEDGREYVYNNLGRIRNKYKMRFLHSERRKFG